MHHPGPARRYFAIPHRYDENPPCDYGDGGLDFAIHVRMGDRRMYQSGTLEYLKMMERIMDQISEAVSEKGLETPVFHVFSETVRRCPSEEAGLFEEFPTWAVAPEEVRCILQKNKSVTWTEVEI